MSGTSVRPRTWRRHLLALGVALSGGLAVVGSPPAIAAPLSCASGFATSNALGPATGWTEFVETDGSRGSESEGAIAYGGNHSAGGMTVGTRLPSGFPASAAALVVAGSHGTYNLQRGSAYLSPKSGVSFNGGSGTGYLASSPIDFGSAFTRLRTLSAAWGAATATGTVSAGTAGGNAALVLTGSSPSLNVFQLTAGQVAQLGAGTHVRYDVPAGSTTIVNVPGAAVTLRGQMWVGGDQANDNSMAAYPGIVWNFPEATSLTLHYGSAWGGHLLAPSAAVTVASVGHTIGQVIARSFASGYETHQLLFPSSACVPSPPSAPGTSDVAISKSASSATTKGGATVVYTLTATNVGDATATGVVLRDVLPEGVTYVSSSAPCARAGGVVTCAVGSLAPGASVSKTITVTTNPIAGAGAGADPQATHWMTPYKVEAQVDLEPGQQRSVTLACDGGDPVGDGQLRVDHVDQGTGTIRDVRILSARSESASSWKGVVRNDATGRAQAKAFVVCLPARSEAAGHRHALSLDSAVPSVTQTYGVGRSSATVTCPTGTVPVAPGFDLSSAAATLVGSETSASSPRTWRFTLDVTAPVTATLSARCLRTTVDPVGGHTHELRFTHVVRRVTVAGATAAQGDEHEVTCPDDGKGVVATFDLPPGVQSFGNDPRLKSRAFRLFNGGGAAQSATIDLVCLHDRTGAERMGTSDPVEVVNTATVSSTSTDANPANNSASTTITVRPGNATAAATGLLRVVRGRARVQVVSAVPGRGTVAVRVGRRVVGKATVKLRPGGRSTARVALTEAGTRALKRATRARVVVDPARGRAVVTVVKVRR